MTAVKVTYEYEWEHTVIYIDLPIPYEEDYQTRMLGHNDMKGLLPVRGNGRDGESRYTFHSTGGMSMEKKYAGRRMSGTEIERFVDQLIETVENLRRHLLDPDGLLIMPELIFLEGENFKFCYLPVKRENREKSLCAQFHQITEYFVKNIDYENAEGVFIVCRLHRETMSENYELKKIIEACRKEADSLKPPPKNKQRARRKEGAEKPRIAEEFTDLSESAIFTVDEEEEKAKESRSRPVRKAAQRIKTGRWGEWNDLITERDLQAGSYFHLDK